jgi:hypothetical protein
MEIKLMKWVFHLLKLEVKILINLKQLMIVYLRKNLKKNILKILKKMEIKLFLERNNLNC